MICFALIQSSESITANEITALTDVTDDFLIPTLWFTTELGPVAVIGNMSDQCLCVRVCVCTNFLPLWTLKRPDRLG